MKKLLLALLCITGLHLAHAQCTIDTTINDVVVPPPGSTIDTANQEVVLPPAYTGQPYTAVLQFKIPEDTTFLGQPAHIDYVQVDALIGLPANFSLSCNPTNCRFLGGDFGCAQIAGTPVNPDSIELKVALEYDITYQTLQGTIKDTIGGYYLPIRGQGVGIDESKLRPLRPKVYPNPANRILYMDLPRETGSVVNIKIFSIVGTLVHESNEKAGSANRIELPVAQLMPGVYLFRFSSSGKTFSGRFSISR